METHVPIMVMLSIHMVNFEKALLRAMELGIGGDTASLQQYARQLLKRSDKDDTPFRQALSKLLAEAAGTGAGYRSVAGSALREMEAFIHVEEPGEVLAPILSAEVDQQIQEIISERDSLHDLLKAGVPPTKSVLLVGPPGVGKTMTAAYFAAVTRTPLVTVDLAAVMSRFLGQTGQNLRAALEDARGHPSVCLLDEFDALGKKRDDPTDVGELKRIVTIVLQELETWPSHGLLIGATNHPELLDRAVWRRFDRVIKLDLPGGEERRKIVSQELGRHGFSVHPDILTVLHHATDGRSGSDLAKLSQEAVRGVILDRWPNVDQGIVELLIRERSDGVTDDARADFVGVATEKAGLSHRATARLLGISHVTVGNILRRP